MKLNKKKKERNFFQKSIRNFFIRDFLFLIFVLLIFLAIREVINQLDFNWIYLENPQLYYFCMDLSYYILHHYLVSIILGIWMIYTVISVYRLLKKFSWYISELTKASKQLLDKDIEYIELPTELNEIALQMNQLKHEAEKNEKMAKESEQRKNDLIVYLAHDLKTPLTSVIGYLELLKESSDLPIEQRIKYTKITLDKAYRLEELMNEFFEIARFNDTNIVLMKKNLNLRLMFEQIVDEFYPLTSEQNKQINIDCDHTIMCYADPDKLSRVFNNVIKNAISYGFENTTIQISAKLTDGQITIAIQNEGYTIPADKLNSIFDKFYRLDSARSTSQGGAGLGLAIAKEIVALHNGTIRAESNNHITTFWITLPE